MKLIENCKKRLLLRHYALDKYIYNILFQYKLSTLKILNEDIINKISYTRNFTKLDIYDKYGILFPDEVIEDTMFSKKENQEYYEKFADILSFCPLEDLKELRYRYFFADIDKEKYDKYLLGKKYDENTTLIKQKLKENELDNYTNRDINLYGDISNYLKYIEILSILFNSEEINNNSLILRYKRVSKLIELLDVENFSDILKRNLTKIIWNSNDIDVNSLEKLENYEEYRNNYYEDKYNKTRERQYLGEIINRTCDYYDKYRSRSNITSIADIQKLFTYDNIGLEKLSALEIKYIKCISLYKLRQYDKLYDYLVENTIDFSEIDYSELYNKIRLLYGNVYFNKLNTNDELLDGATMKEINGIKVYNMAELKDFKMLVHGISCNGGSNKKIKERLYDDPALYDSINGTNYISCSYITDDGIFCVSVNIIYGYNEIEHDALVAISNSDAGTSHDINRDINGAPIENLFLPENLINHSSFYNEVSIKRYLKDGSRRRPKYILSFDEKIDDAAYAHARYFGIPIININKRLYYEKKLKQIEELEKIKNDSDDYKKKIMSEYTKCLNLADPRIVNSSANLSAMCQKRRTLHKEVYGYDYF